MAQTTGKTAKTPAAPAARTATQGKSPTHKTVDLVDRTADLSEEVLKSVEAGQRAAIVAVRKFVETVDEALPAHGDRPSRRETVIDAALDMADKLVTTQYEFLRSVVRSVGPLVDQAGSREGVGPAAEQGGAGHLVGVS